MASSGVRWTCVYERASVMESMSETAKQHVQTLQVQGLYLSKANHQLPIDFAAHWLLPHPFGSDSRYDPVSAEDMPAYKPQAAQVRCGRTRARLRRAVTRQPPRRRGAAGSHPGPSSALALGADEAARHRRLPPEEQAQRPEASGPQVYGLQ